MRRLTYGEGLDETQYDNFVETLVKKLGVVADAFFSGAFGVLTRHAKMLARCSKWQYSRLKREVKALKLGRVRQISDILDKIQLYGGGHMALHVARNGGITAATFLALSQAEQDQLNSGEVLLRWRGDVMSIKAVKLIDKQMATIVRSCQTVLGAKILTPEEQAAPRPRVASKFYTPVGQEIDGDTIVVSSQIGRSRCKTRFERRSIERFMQLAKVVLRNTRAG